MVLRALRPFTTHADVAQVVLVLAPEYIARPPGFLAALSALSAQGSGQALSLVSGGPHRGDSVRSGIAALRPECHIVLVHDGARPFVEARVIDAVIECARQGEAAVPAIPLSDTLKEVDPNDPSRIVRTWPRTRIWRAQTPQAFPRAALEQAHARAARLGRRATDDAALVEAMGLKVRLVAGSSSNIKITTPEDFALAELIAGATR